MNYRQYPLLRPDEADASLIAMQRQRYQQMVRSTMVLSITELLSRISVKQVSKLSPLSQG